MNARIARAIALAGAPLLAFSVVSQGWISTEGAVAEGHTALVGVWRYLCYFTVLTNVLVVATWVRAALKPEDRTGLNAPRFELLTLTSILFVGIVYNTLLAWQWDPQGLQKYNDDILHIWSPIVFAVFWLLRPHGALHWRNALLAAAWPTIYSVYGLTRGALDGYYPYFFMDPTQAPWLIVARNMAGLVVAFILGALIFVTLDRLIARAPKRVEAASEA